MTNFTPQKLCAWITRHPPQPDQAQSLKAAGYKVIQYAIRDKSGSHVLERIRGVLGCDPDLIVAALPKKTLAYLAHHAPCPVVVAEMDHSYVRPRWTGHWRQVVRMELHTEPFSP